MDDADILEEDVSAEVDVGTVAATNPVSLAGLVRCLGFVCLTGLSLVIVAAAVSTLFVMNSPVVRSASRRPRKLSRPWIA
jgi:hypothetical protein